MNPLIIGSNGAVAAIDPESGNVLWKTVLKSGGLISATSREDISVLVQGSVVFAGGAGHLFCLDADSGRERNTIGTDLNGANLRTIWDDTVLCKSPSMEAWQRLTPPVEPKVAQPSWL